VDAEGVGEVIRASVEPVWVLVARVGERELCVDLVGSEIVVGASACDVVLADPTVSRRHAALRAGDGGFELEDLGSRNGTRIEGEPVRRPAWVSAGTTLHFGRVPARLERSHRVVRADGAIDVLDPPGASADEPSPVEGCVARFAVELVPRLVALLRPGAGAREVARAAVAALVASSECRSVVVEMGSPPATLHAADRGHGEGFVATLTADAGMVRVRAGFDSEAAARTGRPVLDLVATLIDLARREDTQGVPSDPSERPPSDV
jgi:pSer/pThr/pTyr-binding forkhead associated (FHA) protein